MAGSLLLVAPAQGQEQPPVAMGADGHLVYTRDALGNRVPDFSYAGYKAGMVPVPEVPVKVVVPVTREDATFRIQAALDYVATLPAGEDGIRGAVLLEKGRYEVRGGLVINASGVILRGSGMGPEGTLLAGTGKKRQTLITIAGEDDRSYGMAVPVTDAYVPVGATVVHLKEGHGFSVGDRVSVERPCTREWIDSLETREFGGGLGYFGWKPGEQNIYWDRTVTAVDGNQVTLDVPLTTALDRNFGGGSLSAYEWPGRIAQAGVENLRLVSTYDEKNPKDENHRWMAITMENVEDAWVRQVVFQHFAGSAVAVYETARRVTVEDCQSLDPVSEIGGHRRYTFFTNGQQTLFQRLYAEHGYHDFAVGHAAAGPNAFVQCKSYLPYNFSGAIDSWASGVLFDIVRVDGHALSFANRKLEAQGAGWSAANSMFWQCSAAKIYCPEPPTATNWAFGAWAQLIGNGYWHEANSHIEPFSLYYAQLADRIGRQAAERSNLLTITTNPTSSPTVSQAADLTAMSTEPAPQLKDWIAQAPQRNPIPADASGVKTLKETGFEQPAENKRKDPAAGATISHGWLVHKDRVLTGRRHQVRWWRGGLRPVQMEKATPHLTRFVPGRTGTGATDDLEAVADWMALEGIVAIDHNYGLWYDRRRDDHERVRRMTGDAWAPFYELPYARSGKGTAWDGLSKYDLTKFNPWYWDRLRQFAMLADEQGLILIHQNYFQHNLIEAGAHWADFPWRTANNINDTGFPEPPPYAGDKRIFLAEAFYDISHPVRRKLHRAYIRKCLDNFADSKSVIQLTSAEYTGPLHFVEFWLDTILEWEEETGHEVITGLSTTKDVQDAILQDRKRAAVVDIIDIRYWHYRTDGSLYAPEGGQNLAPRQHARLVSPGKKSFSQTYRAVREYREKYPGKAVMYSAGGDEELAWGSFMAGGSLAAIPAVSLPGFLSQAADMSPVDLPGSPEGQWALGSPESGYIIYSRSSDPVRVPVQDKKSRFTIRWINPENGEAIGKEARVRGDELGSIKSPRQGPVVLWVHRDR